MALKVVPPPPDETKYHAPGIPKVVLGVGVAGLALLTGLGVLFLSTEEVPTPTEVPVQGPPSLTLDLSLIVPGPMQVARDASEGEAARPDDAALFRVTVRGSGYVFLALEGPDGRLARIYGGHPDDQPLSGTSLLKDPTTHEELAMTLEPHRGTTLMWVAALSSVPWDPLPERIPKEPTQFPDPASPLATSPSPTLLSWDRFYLYVAKDIASATVTKATPAP